MRSARFAIGTLLTVVLMLVAVLIPTADVAIGHSGDTINSNWAVVEVTIDGTISEGEWADAAEIPYPPDSGATGYVKNDSVYIYGALTLPDPYPGSPGDMFLAFFDYPHDGVLTEGGEDGKSLRPNQMPTWVDWHYSSGDWLLDTQQDGLSAFTHSAGIFTMEIKLPLDSGDEQDASLSAGDTVGLTSGYIEGTWGASGFWPPAVDLLDPETWGDLVTASPPPPEEGGGCFIATAAYGTPMAEEIDTLREFRDQYLLTNPVGEALVELYYKTSPPVANFIAEHPSLKQVVRTGLEPVIAMSTVVVNTAFAQKMAIASLVVLVSSLLVVWFRRRAGIGSTS